MHERLKKDGLAVISISVDDKDDEAAALKALIKWKAAFPNFLVNDEDGLTKEWEFNAVPHLVVFDRAGKAKVFKDEAKTEEIEKYIESILKK